MINTASKAKPHSVEVIENEISTFLGKRTEALSTPKCKETEYLARFRSKELNVKQFK